MAGRRSSDSARQQPADRLQVLVIDDEPTTCALLVQQLRRGGFDAEATSDGLEGLRRARSRLFDAIVLDDRLIGVSGRKVLSDLRVSGSHTPVLMLTGFPSEQAKREVSAYVATSYCQKPINAPALVAAVRGLIDASRPGKPGVPPVLRFREALLELQAPPVDRVRLLGRIARDLGSSDMTLFAFLAGCRAFASLASGQGPVVDELLVQQTHQRLHGAVHRDWRRLDPRLAAVLDSATRTGDGRDLASVAAFATALRLDVRRAASLLATELAVDLATLRLAIRVRPLLADLVGTSEHVSQIGYRHGYEHLSQVDRDLWHLLNASPKQFRAFSKHTAGLS